MSIKTKIRSLIAAANTKTGKGDTDLTTAVQSLISESGGITPSGNKAITATTSTQTGIDVTNYATVSVAPTPSEAIVVTTNGDATPSSGKLLSKVTVNVPTGEARDASDLTVSGATVNVPAGLYSSAASKSVASGTAGTPTASKGAVSNNSVTVTPSVANTTGYITGGTKTGAGVKVSASELVSGNKAITPSETAQSGIDVTNFKTASVGAISSTYVGSGVTKKAAATVAPSTSEQTVCASGVYTTGEQKVSAITPSIVSNLDADSFASAIVAAIEGKGVTVPAGAKLSALAALVESIKTGDEIIRKAINRSYSEAPSSEPTVHLENIVAHKGYGFFPANTVNCTIQSSSKTPGDGASRSVRVIPDATGECTLTSAKHHLVASHKYYLSFKVCFETQTSATFDWYWPVAEPSAVSGLSASGDANTWTRLSAVFGRTNFTDGDYPCRWDYNNDSGSNTPVRMSSCMLFDLTAAFGAGNEPSKEWMDTHIVAFGDALDVHYMQNLDDVFADIAAAIRAKDGSSGGIYACDFAARIRNL